MVLQKSRIGPWRVTTLMWRQTQAVKRALVGVATSFLEYWNAFFFISHTTSSVPCRLLEKKNKNDYILYICWNPFLKNQNSFHEAKTSRNTYIKNIVVYCSFINSYTIIMDKMDLVTWERNKKGVLIQFRPFFFMEYNYKHMLIMSSTIIRR